jgi:heat shock protein HslJ
MKSLFLFIYCTLTLISCNTNKNISESDFAHLQDIWAITSLSQNGLAVEADFSQGNRPVMELNITEMKMYGHDGCNDIFGPIKTLDSSSISFGNIAGTKMLCPNMTLPNAYIKALHQVKFYERKELVLTFFDEQHKETLRFRKVD